MPERPRQRGGPQGGAPPGEYQGGASWSTSHLPSLTPGELEAVSGLMAAWYAGRAWSPPPGCREEVLWPHLDRQGLSGLLGAMSWERRQGGRTLGELAMPRYWGNTAGFHQAKAVLAELARQAQALGLGAVVLKGPALTAQAYGDPGARPFSDIDLFVASRRDAWRLCRAAGARLVEDSARCNLLERLAEPENLKFVLGKWVLEVRYPHPGLSEPMFDFLERWREELFGRPASLESMLDPDPSLHLVFLIQHMAVHHLFSRPCWFLDLAVLVRRQGARLDLELVASELTRLGLANAGAVASRFCQRHLDPVFPDLAPGRPHWNLGLMQRMASPRAMAGGRFGIYHQGWAERIWAYTVAAGSFFLVEDPPPAGGRGSLFGLRWMEGRLGYALRLGPGVVRRLLGRGVAWGVWAFSRLVVWLLEAGR